MKRCGMCGELKLFEEFHKYRRSRDGLQSVCKECRKKLNQERSEQNPDYQREYGKQNKNKYADSQLRRNYGISLEHYDQMYNAQHGKCMICGKRGKRVGQGHKPSEVLVVDHNHSTGEVRSLLCHSCNKAIGLLVESGEIIIRALVYIDMHKGVLDDDGFTDIYTAGGSWSGEPTGSHGPGVSAAGHLLRL